MVVEGQHGSAIAQISLDNGLAKTAARACGKGYFTRKRAN
jgi:hypothetical protein